MRKRRLLNYNEIATLNLTINYLRSNQANYDDVEEFKITSKSKFLPDNRTDFFKTSYFRHLDNLAIKTTATCNKTPKVPTLLEYLPWYRNGIARFIRKEADRLVVFGESRLLTKEEQDKISEAAQILNSIIDKENYVKNTNYLKTKL